MVGHVDKKCRHKKSLYQNDEIMEEEIDYNGYISTNNNKQNEKKSIDSYSKRIENMYVKKLKKKIKKFSYPEYRRSSGAQILCSSGSEYLLTTDCRLQSNHQQTLLQIIPTTSLDTNPLTNCEELKRRRTSSACSLGQQKAGSTAAAQLMLSRKTMRKLKKNRSVKTKWRNLEWTGEKV